MLVILQVELVNVLLDELSKSVLDILYVLIASKGSNPLFFHLGHFAFNIISPFLTQTLTPN